MEPKPENPPPSGKAVRTESILTAMDKLPPIQRLNLIGFIQRKYCSVCGMKHPCSCDIPGRLSA